MVTPGAVVQVTPLSLAMWGLERRDFFAVVLTFPLPARSDPSVLVGYVQWTRVHSLS